VPDPPRRVLETSLYADDLAAAERFYGDVLGLEAVLRQDEQHVSFRCGAAVLHVFRLDAAQAEGSVPSHGAEGPGHVAFAVSSDVLDAWIDRFEEAGVAVEQTYTWDENVRSVYVRDPAGNSVELVPPALWPVEDEAARSDAVVALRPTIPLPTPPNRPMERFQHTVLRPICKRQNPLILQQVAHHLAKYNTGFAQMDPVDQRRRVEQLLKEDSRLKHMLCGLVAGLFTADEYAFYLEHQREVRRRLTELLVKRVQDQLERLRADYLPAPASESA
jgi:catechol 2,3-dioxygenase-like lactoylglutathione lyase family enzyme